jgi:hypothetical protein
MATRKGNYLTGVLGPLVLRVVNGKQVVSTRVKRGKIKHTEATKKSNQTFGMASALAADVRYTIAEHVIGMSDYSMCSRLSGAFFSVFSKVRDKATREYNFRTDSFESLVGFNFHQSYKVANRIATMPEMKLQNGIMEVSFPRINEAAWLQYPYNSYKCTVKATVSLFMLKEGLMVSSAETQQKVLLKGIAVEEPLAFNFQVPNGCFYIVCLYLNYAATGKNGVVLATQPKMGAGAICYTGIAPGDYDMGNNLKWVSMQKYL